MELFQFFPNTHPVCNLIALLIIVIYYFAGKLELQTNHFNDAFKLNTIFFPIKSLNLFLF